MAVKHEKAGLKLISVWIDKNIAIKWRAFRKTNQVKHKPAMEDALKKYTR